MLNLEELNQTSAYLSEFQLLNLETILNEFEQKFQYQINLLSPPKHIIIKEEIEIPVRLKMELQFLHGLKIFVVLTESSPRDYSYYKQKFKLCLHYSSQAEETMGKFFPELLKGLETTIPEKFISMEHLRSFLKEPYSMNLFSLPENLILSAWNSIFKLFDGYKLKGEIPLLTNTHSPEKIRIEVADKVYKYANVNIFQTFEKDNIIFALGIAKDVSFDGHFFYSLTAFVENTQSIFLQSKFDLEFEKLLYEDSEIKGGKFTGDQKIIKLNSNLTLDDLILEESIKENIKREIFDFFKMRTIYSKANLPFKRGVALYGPPGTGKTMLAKIIVSQMSETVIWVKAGDMHNPSDIDRIFRFARLGRPTVIILEDIDFYITDREVIDGNKFNVATLMGHLDGLEENDGILTIITTNRIETIEKAIIDRPGRIDAKIFMGELGRALITKLVETKLENFKKEFSNLKSIIPDNTVMTGSMAVELSSMVIKFAIRDSQNENIIIKEEHVKKAVKEIYRLENKKRAGFD
ncbi:MAG TPA: AAA family ATPase [Leptospiraceae bacterium]|nr:AAA family ATPase [Leptospiraceae bacterium]HRG75268.1 AAA family ATPase [Leptospiraceae bacterium]